MKKIIPIIAITGTICLLSGCDSMMNMENKFKDNLNKFESCLQNYNKINNNEISRTVNNYKLKLSIPDNATLVDSESKFVNEIDNKEFAATTQNSDLNIQENTSLEIEQNEKLDTEIDDGYNDLNNEENVTETEDLSEDIEESDESDEQISTLYSLSNDIENSCDDFCKLKEKLLSAISETENLINKLQTNEVTLTREQRLLINEQSFQLKNLARQLSNATTELSFNLSDLNEIMKQNNKDFDAISLKYLVVLDNLVNGNEMLQNGLSSLNLVNNMFNLKNYNTEPNNKGRILYGFQKNNEEPIIKDYSIDENGELKDNTIDNQNIETNNEIEDVKKTNIDTYKNTNLKSNLDTFGNNRQNIDTFYNTALLDNEFMYGNNGFAGGYGMYGYGNPNLNQYNRYLQNNKDNTTNSTQNENITQDTETKLNNKKTKKFKLKSNVDTYRDANTPNVKTKINNFKQSISKFFKLKCKPNDEIKNPIYRYNPMD